jgi:hypothetical protein
LIFLSADLNLLRMEISKRISQRTTRIQCNIHVRASTYSVYQISSLSECNGFRAGERELACEEIRHVRTYCMFMQCGMKEIVPEVLPISLSMNVLRVQADNMKIEPMNRISRKILNDKIRISLLF